MPQLDEPLDNFVEVDRFAMRRLLARKRQEVHHQLGRAVAFMRRLFQIRARLRAQLMMGQHQFQVTFDHRQRIVQFMRDAGNHLADGGEFFRLAQLLFQPRALRQFQQGELVGAPAVEINSVPLISTGRADAVLAHQD